MATRSKPFPVLNTGSQPSSAKGSQHLAQAAHRLAAMERQYRAAEDLELPEEVLAQWREAIARQRRILAERCEAAFGEGFGEGGGPMAQVEPAPVEEIRSLEHSMRRAAAALGEAWMRSAAGQACSPFQAGDPQDWSLAIQAFSEALDRDRVKLEQCLAAIGWQGPGLPPDPGCWPAWWRRVCADPAQR